MARLDLVYLRSAPLKVGSDIIHYERIKAYLEIGSASIARKECLVDTGAPLSVFPELTWKRFEPEITWLYIPGTGLTLPNWLANVTGLAAAPIACRIGKVRIQIVELPLSWPVKRSPAIEIVAKFSYDNGAYPQILLGLGGGAFLPWNLMIDSTNAQAWLEF